MLLGLYAGAAGLNAQQHRLDALASDLANVSTTGYKSQRVAFADLVYQAAGQADAVTADSQFGAGALAVVLDRDQAQGAFTGTENPLDVAIGGTGFLQVRRADGSVGLTRAGALGLDAQGRLQLPTGELIQPEVRIPADVDPARVSISPDGQVRAGERPLGRIQLVTVAAPQRLQQAENNLLLPTDASGPVRPAAAGEAQLVQGALEQSNVDVAASMGELIEAQKAFEMCSRVVRNHDELLSIVNSTRRG